MIRTRRFPWVPLLLAWAAASIILTLLFRVVIQTGAFADTDDYMRLQQVRDLTTGQGWFDLTQYRINPPAGLPMHWSRLVDLPVLAFMVPLIPIIGRRYAETVAIVGAPVLNLLVLMVAVTFAVRWLNPRTVRIAMFACLFAIAAPSVLAQIHPARIDHHGWQIALAAASFAALLDPRPTRSGLIAGAFAALYLAISIEGAPFVAVAFGAVAILWVLKRENGTRLARFAQSLGGTSLVANLLLAPSARWSETSCDAVMTGHLAAMLAASVTVTLAVRFADDRRVLARSGALAIAGLLAIAPLLLIAPNCVGSPFGTMDPLVHRLWLQNVPEGMPFWRQDHLDAVSMLAFPIVGLIGAALRLRRVGTPEARRRWWLVLIIGAATLVTGALVRRAAGIAHIVAIPGALVLLEWATAWAEHRRTAALRVLANAFAILLLSPIGAVYLTAAFWPPKEQREPMSWQAQTTGCDVACATERLDALPPETMMNEIDLGPILLVRTHHRAFVASYHRLQVPLAETLRFFMGSADDAHAFMQKHKLRSIIVEPTLGETSVYRKEAPKGFATQLVDGKLPPWLHQVDYGGGKSLLLFRVVER